MTDRKNILLISLDDAFAYWKYRSAFGAELKTPNLDRICEVSTAFHSAYCQVPVCGPSRSSFMSALTPHELGIFDNYTSVFDVLRPEQMWPYRLKQEGFYCSNAGKVHHGYKPLPADIHNVLYSHPPEPINIGPGGNAKVKDFGGLMKGLGTIDPQYDDRYYDARSAGSAINFLESYNRDVPFYREVGFYHPHSPYKTPLRFKEMYDPEQFQQPDIWAEGYDKNAYADMFMQENIDASNIDLWQKSVRNYFSAFSHVDYHLGQVWDALQSSAHAKNTIVVILADHGYHVGDKNRFRKYTLWEEAAGVPLIIHDPDKPKAREVHDAVALLDVGPTVLDYAGCAPIHHCAGRSLRPQVEGKSVKDRAVPTFFFGSAAIRKCDYRYIYYQDGSCQLYNMKNDLWQMRDISKNSAEKEEMHSALIEVCREYGLNICNGKNDTLSPNAYFSVPDDADGPKTAASKGCISIGNLSDTDTSPQFRKHFATLIENDILYMSDSMRALYLAADYRIGTDHFRIVGNDKGNVFDFVGGHNRFLLDINCGNGNDIVRGHLDRLRIKLNAGNNHVITGHTGAEVYGGSGYDEIETANGTNHIRGGTGDALIIAGQGNDTIITGSGRNTIKSLGGTTHITIDAGINDVEIMDGEIVLIIKRTGLCQTVKGFSKGQINLSDWSGLSEIEIIEHDNGDTVVTAGTDRVRFIQTKREHIENVLSTEDNKTPN